MTKEWQSFPRKVNWKTHTPIHYTDLTVLAAWGSQAGRAGPGWGTGLWGPALQEGVLGTINRAHFGRSSCLMRHTSQRTMFNYRHCFQFRDGRFCFETEHCRATKTGPHSYSSVSYQTKGENKGGLLCFKKQKKLSTQRFSCHDFIFWF